MPTITAGSDVHTVIVQFVCGPADQDELVRLATASEAIFAKQPGFVGSSLHQSTDGTRVLQYLQWRTKADSDSCMMSPDWQTPTAMAMMAFIGAGKATMQPQDFTVVSAQHA